MYILSQDKTRIYNMSGHIEGIMDMKNQKTTNKERVKTSGIRFRYLMDAQRRSRSSKRKKIVCW